MVDGHYSHPRHELLECDAVGVAHTPSKSVPSEVSNRVTSIVQNCCNEHLLLCDVEQIIVLVCLREDAYLKEHRVLW